MKLLFAGGMCTAVAVTFGVVVFAQSTQAPAQPPAQQAPAKQERTLPEQQVTLVGCVQREADYRRAKEAGRGGVAGTGVGVGNEFILVNASMTPAGTATGTAGGTSTAAADYELTGENEKQVEQYVGKRVEIAGKLKAAEASATGTTGGATAGKPPSGIDVMSKDLKLRELEVASVRETTGTCPTK